jgi:hypothetical protein
MTYIQAPDVKIPHDLTAACLAFLQDRQIRSIDTIPFEALKAELGTECSRHLRAGPALQILEDPDAGVVSFTHGADSIDMLTQLLLSSCMFHLVNTSIYTPIDDPKNETPFTLYESSLEGSEAMETAGVKFNAPDRKLGYHNDLFHLGDHYFLPKFISVVNLFIGYHEPGNFYFLNKNQWADFDRLYAHGVDRRFRFRPTPTVYSSTLHIARQPDEWWLVPAFWRDASGERHVFSNGELADDGDDGIVNEVKDSFMANQVKFSIPQELGKVIVFRNDLGFHSRDVFRKQHVFEGITRLMLRGVSREHVDIPGVSRLA